MPPPCLTTLPTEILEPILLHLPGQDIIKVEAVRRSIVNEPEPSLTFCNPGKPTLPGSRSQLARSTAPIRAL